MLERHPDAPSGTGPLPEALAADDPRHIGGYRLHARLGSGGMGVVYLAYTPGGRPIALKAVRREFAADPEFRERFAREVASARRIHGLFTAQVVDSGVDDHTPWLATTYVAGPSLQEVVRRHGPLPVRTVLLLVAGIAEALQVIHGAGVVHRDLKPANVLIAGDGPRVIDFGIARAADAVALTGAGLRIGTAAFMAPEQALGLPVTPATDVFALGALAAYVAGGSPPFGEGPESGALYRVVHEHPDLTRIPRDLHDLVAWCLAKRPEDRPGTAALIAAVHAHPSVGPRPEFTDGWLPRPVLDEVGGSGAVRHAPTVLAPPAPAPAPGAPAVAPPAPPAASPAPAPGSAPASAPTPGSGRRAGAGGRQRVRTVLPAVAATLLVCAGAVYCLDGPAGEGADGSAASEAPAYRPGYARTELTSPDAGYEFDLTSGKVAAATTVDWYLAREGRGFVPSEESDSFVSATGELTAEDCVHGIEAKPAAALPFEALTGQRPFCVSSPDRSKVAIVRLVAAAADGAVTIVVDQYLRN
ncbi:serine/threonine-protein kinase [Streptomyces lavendulae]|uniref:serine/threonine-protein kinase n=2 Tax=Streptomyces lavendulae TaxID=1914 RepID=UPI0036EAEE11